MNWKTSLVVGLVGASLSASPVAADETAVRPVAARSVRAADSVFPEADRMTLQQARESVGHLDAAAKCISAQRDAMAKKHALLEGGLNQVEKARSAAQERRARRFVQAVLRDMGRIRAAAGQCMARTTGAAPAKLQNLPKPAASKERSGFILAPNVRLDDTRWVEGNRKVSSDDLMRVARASAESLASCYTEYVERRSPEIVDVTLDGRFASDAKTRRVRMRRLRPGDVQLKECVVTAFARALPAANIREGRADYEFDFVLGPAALR